jgi:plastocyanin
MTRRIDMTRQLAFWLSLAFLAACQNSENADVVTTDVAATVDATSSTAPTTMTVTVGANSTTSYTPSALTINQGDTVHWVWADPVTAHTVTSGVPGAPDGKFCSLPPGSVVNAQTCTGTSYAMTAPYTFDHVFNQAGTYPYHCEVHGALMTGMITVNPVTTTTMPTMTTTPPTPTTPVPTPTTPPTPTPPVGGY